MMTALTRRDRIRIALDHAGTWVAIAAVVLALIPLVALIGFVISKGASSINLDFFTQNPAPQGFAGGGWYPIIVGSLIVMAVSSAMGIPFGLLSGIYLARAGNGPFTQLARFVTDVIAGTPSILAGVIVAALIVLPTTNESAFAASIALALLMFPTVTRATEAALRAVPAELREAALGLGAPEWKLILRVTVPTAASGIVTAVILGIARVAGETAPLYLTMGSNTFLNTNVFSGPMGALPTAIWEYSQTGSPVDADKAFAGAFVLFGLIAVLNLIARMLTYRLSKRTRIA